MYSYNKKSKTIKNFKYNKCDFILMTEIIFGGHNWITRNNYGGPGPNHFSHDNVWLDENKNMHLRVSETEDK